MLLCAISSHRWFRVIDIVVGKIEIVNGGRISETDVGISTH